MDVLAHNTACIKAQLEKFLDFNSGPQSAEIVNNYDWFKDISFLDFIRDTGKHITVNYMLAKDSVKNRLETGMSFTEFTYQLVQGYDFYHLYKHKNVKLQLGGSDQFGNIVTGTELIRRKEGGEAFAITAPLVTKADGTKFGKSEGGNVWLDAKKTSPYKFYQFWMNINDDDAPRYLRLFTFMEKEAIEALTAEHAAAPHLRLLQKELAKLFTTRVHSEEDYLKAVRATDILFGKATKDALTALSEEEILEIFEGVPQFHLDKSKLAAGLDITEFLTDATCILASKSEARRQLQANSMSLNQEKVNPESKVSEAHLLNAKYLLVQKGKKEYFLVIAA
jgi:tyrosyl-tRNA synthetase